MMSRNLYWIVTAVFAIAFASALSIAADKSSPSPTPKKADSNTSEVKLTGDYAEIAREAKVTDAKQQEELHKVQLEQEAALKKFDADNKPKVDAAEKKRSDAKSDKEKEGPNNILKGIAADREKVILQCKIKAFNKLNNEQKILFTTYRLSTAINEHFKTLALTDDQKTKVADLITSTIKKVPVQPIDTYNPQTVSQIEAEAVKLLGDTQRAAYNDLKLRDFKTTK